MYSYFLKYKNTNDNGSNTYCKPYNVTKALNACVCERVFSFHSTTKCIAYQTIRNVCIMYIYTRCVCSHL